MASNQKLAYTVDEAVGATGLSRSRLYHAIAHRELATFKAGRRRMVSLKALQEYIGRLERESTKGAA